MNIPTRLLRLPAALALLTAVAAAHAAPPAGDPRALVEDSYVRIRAVSERATSQAELTRDVIAILGRLIDWSAFSRLTLTPPVWDALTPAQRARFEAAYEAYIIERYAQRFKPGTGFRVAFRGPTELAEDRSSAIVRTTVTVPSGEREVGADVDYAFVASRRGDESVWLIEDIVTDTVSRAHTYRPIFTRIYRERGFDALIEAIEKNSKRDRAGKGGD